MATYTTKYHLKKPALEDFGDVADINANMDIIDETLTQKADLDDSGKLKESQLPSLSYVPVSQKGAAGGVASLDTNGKVPSSQLPSYVDDVLEGYLYNGAFYADDAHAQQITPEHGKIYVAQDTNKTYRWSGTHYVEISESLALGETTFTAYPGDKGKEAHDHMDNSVIGEAGVHGLRWYSDKLQVNDESGWQSVDGNGYATCTTAATTTAKTVSISGYTPVSGGIVVVRFTYAVPANATLNISGKGAKSIYYNNTAITAGIINAGDTVTFIYSGEYYHLICIDRAETTAHKVTTLTSSATDDQYPSAKAVYDMIGDVDTAIAALNAMIGGTT